MKDLARDEMGDTVDGLFIGGCITEIGGADRFSNGFRAGLNLSREPTLWKYATLGSNDQGISDPWSRLWEAVQPWFGDTKDWRSQGLGKPRRLEHLGISIVSLFKG